MGILLFLFIIIILFYVIEKVCLLNRIDVKSDCAENEVIRYLYEQVTNKQTNFYYPSRAEVVMDEKIYELIKRSWIGAKCKGLASLHTRLKEKNKTSQMSLLELLY